MGLPKIVCIVGSTASGKTDISLGLAKTHAGEVVVADSRQVYRYMDIGTAKPEGEWKEEDIHVGGDIRQLFGKRKSFFVEGVPHWGFDVVDPGEEYSVSEWKHYAKERISDISQRGHVPFVVGGTGLYIQALVDNMEFPEVAPNMELRATLEQKPTSVLYHEYKQLDPVGAQLIDKANPRRLIRAIEVSLALGMPFSAAKKQGPPLYDVLQIGIQRTREELSVRIDERVEFMIAKGLVGEVRSLHETYGSAAVGMDGIGYKEICQFLEGTLSLKEAIAEIKTHTKQYAKRQMTWFGRDGRIHWVSSLEEAEAHVRAFL